MTALNDLLKVFDLEEAPINAVQHNPQNITLSIDEKTFEKIIEKLKDEKFIFRGLTDSNNSIRLHFMYNSDPLKIELITLKVFSQTPEFKKNIDRVFSSQ